MANLGMYNIKETSVYDVIKSMTKGPFTVSVSVKVSINTESIHSECQS